MLSKRDKFLFGYYAYLAEICWFIANFLPPMIRVLIFKIALAKLGKNSYIDYRVYIRYPRRVYIGNNCEINRNCQFFPSYKTKDTAIILGDNVVVAPNVVFFGAGQSTEASRLDVSESIVIEDNVYIGGNSVIRYGVRLGKGSTVAANSTVVHDVEPFSVVGGCPARRLN